MNREPIIFHIDVNSAFLSWTALARLKSGDPVDLRQIPSIIGGSPSDRHGVVFAKSIPAKSYGIVTGGTCGKRPAQMSPPCDRTSRQAPLPAEKRFPDGVSVKHQS